MKDKNQKINKKAVALKYDLDKDEAPVVIGSGQGELAERILKIAAEHEIPIKEDQDLVDILVQLDPGDQIPPELYRVVAEVLSFIYRLDK